MYGNLCASLDLGTDERTKGNGQELLLFIANSLVDAFMSYVSTVQLQQEVLVQHHPQHERRAFLDWEMGRSISPSLFSIPVVLKGFRLGPTF